MSTLPVKSEAVELQVQLQELAGDIAAALSGLDADASRELLGGFVSDLFLAMARQSQREVRRQRQAEGIAAAKAKGVRFGREPKPVPGNFDEIHRLWRAGEVSATQAADLCGVSRTTFYNLAARREQAAG